MIFYGDCIQFLRFMFSLKKRGKTWVQFPEPGLSYSTVTVSEVFCTIQCLITTHSKRPCGEQWSMEQLNVRYLKQKTKQNPEFY